MIGKGLGPSHPELLSFLARELTAQRLRLQTRRTVDSQVTTLTSELPSTDRSPKTKSKRYFESPRQRRMTAEQVVDSLHVAVGRSMDSDELTFDPEARMKPAALGSLGRPTRAWQFASLSNERDRPALSLPRAAAVCECLEAFGWKGTRQEPINHRPDQANVLQPAILASGLLSIQLTRLTDRRRFDIRLCRCGITAAVGRPSVYAFPWSTANKSRTETIRRLLRKGLRVACSCNTFAARDSGSRTICELGQSLESGIDTDSVCGKWNVYETDPRRAADCQPSGASVPRTPSGH